MGMLGMDTWIYGLSFAHLYACVLSVCVLCMGAQHLSMHVGSGCVRGCELGEHGCIAADASNNMASVVSFQRDVHRDAGLKPSVCFIFVLI